MADYLVFGATGHIGGPCARTLVERHGATCVRVASHRDEGLGQLRDEFHDCEALQADMMSVASMREALDGVLAVFIVTPDFFDDEAGAHVLVEACEALDARPHIVRVQAEIPDLKKEQLTGLLANRIGRYGHIVARETLTASNLPSSFLNVFGYYMDDLTIHFGEGIRQGDTLMVPYDRPMCWIDPKDLGEAAAKVMMSPPPTNARIYHLNSGEPPLLFSELAQLLSRTIYREVRYVDDDDLFRELVGPALLEMTGNADATEYLLADWRNERAHSEAFVGTASLARLLGRQPFTLAEWMAQHCLSFSA